MTGAVNILRQIHIDFYMILYTYAHMHTVDSGYTYIRVHLMTGAAGWTGGAHGFVGECDGRHTRRFRVSPRRIEGEEAKKNRNTISWVRG